jgi:hypothetical protein
MDPDSHFGPLVAPGKSCSQPGCQASERQLHCGADRSMFGKCPTTSLRAFPALDTVPTLRGFFVDKSILPQLFCRKQNGREPTLLSPDIGP